MFPSHLIGPTWVPLLLSLLQDLHLLLLLYQINWSCLAHQVRIVGQKGGGELLSQVIPFSFKLDLVPCVKSLQTTQLLELPWGEARLWPHRWSP